jgi:nucleotide-binding universal stress UspA family protein
MAIIQFATKERIDLIVCTNRGSAGSRPWGQGSVAMKVLRKAPCDTMMVRSDTRVTLSFTRILVALDGSELAERALVPAVSLAKAMSAEMLLFRATPPIALAIGPDEAEVIKPRLLGQVELYLGQIRDRLMNGRQVEIVAQTGPVAQSILDHAKMKTADLIILTSHGATGSKQWSLGGVANKVLLGARCAVLIVRSGLSG